MSKKTGGPAFPAHGTMGEVVSEGMTLRDYFAAKAMAAFIVVNDPPAKVVAEWAYAKADAMLAERSTDNDQ